MKIINKVKISLLIIFFVVLIFTGKSFAVTGVITEITVNLRKEPSTNSKKIMYVTQDDVVDIIEKDGEWYKIKFQGKIGYVFGEYIKVNDNLLEEATNKSEKTETTKEEKTKKQEDSKDIKNEVQDVAIDTPAELQIIKKAQIRLIPNISSNVIYTAKKNTTINLIEQLDHWSYISVDNIIGWVRTEQIIEKNSITSDNKKEVEENNEDKIQNTETKIAYIKYDRVNLRKKASTNATILARLKINEQVTVIEEVDSKWSKVNVDGIIGYISTELLANKKQNIEATNKIEDNTTSRDGDTSTRKDNEKTDTVIEKNKDDKKTKENQADTSENEATQEIISKEITGDDIVNYAKKYLGYKYLYGGSTPKSGFDCSGFTKYVYNHFGYTISRSSKAQANEGKNIKRSDLQAGDLIIFKNQSLTAIGHVGIYIGNNKMIHASEPGIGVVITDLDANGYNYNKRYVTARRII